MLTEILPELFEAIVIECGDKAKNLIPCCKLFSTLPILIKRRQERINDITKNIGNDYNVVEMHITHLIVSCEEIFNTIQLDDTVIDLRKVARSGKAKYTKHNWYDISSYHGMCKKVVIDRFELRSLRNVKYQRYIRLPFDIKLMIGDSCIMLCVDKMVCSDFPRRLRACSNLFWE